MHVLMTSLWTCQGFSHDNFPALGNFSGLGMALGRKKAWESPGKALGKKVVSVSGGSYTTGDPEGAAAHPVPGLDLMDGSINQSVSMTFRILILISVDMSINDARVTGCMCVSSKRAEVHTCMHAWNGSRSMMKA